jgi:uncharacterized protein (DUF433 family)
MYTGLKRDRVRGWFTRRNADSRGRAIFQSDYEAVDGDQVISFLDLVDLVVAGQLREHGVSWQDLSTTHSVLQKLWDTKHPFARKEVRHFGGRIFALAIDGVERKGVSDVAVNPRVFEDFILPVLERMDYDGTTLLARKWRLAPMVALNPAINFGKPSVESTGLPTRILSAAFHANGEDARLVARWYGVREEHVRAAVDFEHRFAS